ncbi:DUF6968 family protein [Leptospira weilii]|uniref:DUF6968 family protein n=1 Tax=Leptospira weilii TaxID=28184 RepID=UPI000774E3F7|nr:hypothetical protein [Leptospira weilii]
MKDPYKLGEIILEREIRFAIDKEKREVLIKIGKPKIHPEPDIGWYCPLQIIGIGPEKIHAALGFDSLDSVENGLKMIGGFLVRYFQKLYPTDLTWLNSEHLGFPSLETLENFAKEETDKMNLFQKHKVQIQWKHKTADAENWI